MVGGLRKKRAISASSSSRDQVRLSGATKAIYDGFLARKHTGTRFYHEPSMRTLGVHEEIVRVFTLIRAERFLEICEPSCPTLTSEFLATLKVEMTSRHLTPAEGNLTFRLGNVDRRIFITDLKRILNLPADTSTDLSADKDLQRFWYKITGLEVFNGRDGFSGAIVHPVFKIIQRILGNTIYGRAECSKMRRNELQCLHNMMHNKQFDLGSEFLSKLQSLALSKSGDIVVGGLITRIARHFEIDLELYSQMAPTYIDLGHLRNIKIIEHGDNDGVYSTKISITNDVKRITQRRVTTTYRSNWYRDWTGVSLNRWDDDSEDPTSAEEEEGDEEDDGDDDDEEVGDGDEHDDDVAMPDAVGHTAPSASGSVPGQELYGRMDALEQRVSRLTIMQEHMYHHTLGYYYDPAAPYPRPLDWPPPQ